MEKKIKNYLHLYLGCKAETRHGIIKLDYNILEMWSRGAYQEIAPILRPLSDMTEDEMNYCIKVFNLGRGIFNMQPSDWVVGWEAYYPECFLYLLSKGFDLFGLIESGLAKDVTKQEVKQ